MNGTELRRLVDAMKAGDAMIASMDAEAWAAAPTMAIMELRQQCRRYRTALELVATGEPSAAQRTARVALDG